MNGRENTLAYYDTATIAASKMFYSTGLRPLDALKISAATTNLPIQLQLTTFN
jgi:hypothetical protein